VYAKLQARVESPKFLEDMKASLHGADDDATTAAAAADDEVYAVEFDVNSPEWWGEEGEESTTTTTITAAATATASASSPASAASDDEGYVMVEKEEVIDALAAFIAGYIAAHPRASSMPPEKLQRALGCAFGELRRGDGGEVRINRSTYQVKPFYLSSETVLPIK
jgi:hypothetical protein